jgi:hypothetical protein
MNLERAGVPEATARMKKSGALRTALHRKKVQVMGWFEKVPSTAADIMAEDSLPVQLTKTLTGQEFLRFKGYTDAAEEKVCFSNVFVCRIFSKFLSCNCSQPNPGISVPSVLT